MLIIFERDALCLGHMIYKLNLELNICTNPPIKKIYCITRKRANLSIVSWAKANEENDVQLILVHRERALLIEKDARLDLLSCRQLVVPLPCNVL